ncbi:uncharacterized protein LOC142328423 [Lycorma delicatula]|uniref:uncharacterized protein LOC142328423 n=1 Tax=Lycorma delicatula TaxID=130591 RepID=UPI003F5109F7
MIKFLDKLVPHKLKPLWNHAAGPKTIFFWAPACKWAIVLAGLGDINRPIEKVSIPQSVALFLTGAVWCKYSLDIIPKNWNLFFVNFMVGSTNIYQLSRAARYKYQMSLKNTDSKPDVNDVKKK